MTPGVELMVAKANGSINETQYQQGLDALSRLDVRNDFNRYVYRPATNQQYAFNISGGSDQ